jgi:hypothetical protein
MLIKWLIGCLFLLALVSLSSGLFFLLKDQQNSTRLLTSLKIRVAICVLLVLLIVYGFWSGTLVNHAPWEQIHQ